LVWQRASYFLDQTYATGSAASFSLRRLSSTYSGPCVKIRRASDNTTSDINFSGGLVDETAISTFCGASNGFVEIWYNQNGSPYHAIQTTTTRQPKIYDGTNGVEKLDGQPVIVCDGSNDCFQVSTFSYPALHTHLMAGSSSTYFTEHGDGTGDKFYCYILGGSYVHATRTTKLEDGGVASFTGTGLKLITWQISGLTASTTPPVSATGGSLKVFENATERSLTYRSQANERILANNNVVTKTLNIFSRNQSSLFSNGKFYELHYFEYPKLYADMASIRNDINAYWTIY